MLMTIKKVAPHAGAWIETFGALRLQWYPVVAPHAGAWIETDNEDRLFE